MAASRTQAFAPIGITGPRALVLAGLLCAAMWMAPAPAHALGPNAVRTPARSMVTSVAVGDDTSNLVVNLPFAMNWNGTSFSQIYINMNGNCTFGQTFTGYDPNPTLASQNRNIMAPFWADVDTRNAASGKVWYSDVVNPPLVDGHETFMVTWNGVARFNTQSTPLDYFQLVLIDRSDTGAGNFDFEFNYDQMPWDRGTASSTGYARAGWAINGGASDELPGSNSNGALLDSGAAATSLIRNTMNSGGQLGRYVWQVRNGGAPTAPPEITVTDRTLEGNTLGGYALYTGAGDVTITDDVSVASSSSAPSLPATLPLGTNSIRWTAVDNIGLSAVETQTVVVTDTVAPSAPALSSSTHTAGVWTNIPTVTVNSVNSTDGCAGVRGASVSWSLNATAAPDTTVDLTSTITTVSMVATTVVDTEDFTSGTWPADWPVQAASTYVRLNATAPRFHNAANAAEVYTDANNNRRVGAFYKTFDLRAYHSATLTFWDYRTALSQAQDYELVRYSTNGGTTWTNLLSVTGASVLQGWLPHTYSLPTTGSVMVEFSGSVNGLTTPEYVDWDDILVQGFRNTAYTSLASTTTTALADGRWYQNVRTVDNAGNWSGTSSFGPVLIDRFPPSTTDTLPTTWSRTPLNVALTATDAGSGVAYTRYRVNGGTVATYTAPFVMSIEQTNTLQYWSVDNRGNSETTDTVQVRIDSGPPTTPTALNASAVSTTSVEMTWTGSTDATSGMSYYRIYSNGSVAATTAATTYTLGGLTAGQTYNFRISAVDVAGNESSLSATDTESMPQAQIWMTLDPVAVDLGAMDPGASSTVTSATSVTVGGVGIFNYTLSTYCDNFSNVATASITPSMPAGLMSYRMYGTATYPLTPFTTTSVQVASGAGVKYVWSRPYFFDFVLNVPYAYAPGTYTTKVTYTVVAN